MLDNVLLHIERDDCLTDYEFWQELAKWMM